MSTGNDKGIIRVGRKGLVKFAFGEEGAPFEVDVIVAFQRWIELDDGFRPADEDAQGNRPIPLSEMPAYHQAAVEFVMGLSGGPAGASPTTVPDGITTAEALEFIARLREQYDELTDFFRAKPRRERDSPATSEGALRFSVEGPAPS